jgi:hypothetical protein
MSDDTDMNAQENPDVATSEVTAHPVPQVETSDLAQGGSGMTPPGLSPERSLKKMTLRIFPMLSMTNMEKN